MTSGIPPTERSYDARKYVERITRPQGYVVPDNVQVNRLLLTTPFNETKRVACYAFSWRDAADQLHTMTRRAKELMLSEKQKTNGVKTSGIVSYMQSQGFLQHLKK
jgi:hypothetical protein